MMKQAMTMEQGIAIEVATEYLHHIKAKLCKLEQSKNTIDPKIQDDINAMHIDIVRQIRVLSTKSIHEIQDIKALYADRYAYFERLLGGGDEG